MPLNDTDVDILIGYDNAYLMKSSAYLQHHNDPQNHPTAVETLLGWYVFGPKTNASTDQLIHVHRVYIDENPRHFYSLYETNVCGVKPTSICTCSDKKIVESQFLKHVRSTIQQTEDGRVEVSLP